MCTNQTIVSVIVAVTVLAVVTLKFTTQLRRCKIAAIVFKHLEPLFCRGHTLWIENFFNSPELARS